MFSSTSSPPGPASMLSLSSNKSSRELLFLVSQTVKHRQKTHKPRTANSTRALHHISLFIVALSHIVGCRQMKNVTFTQISRKKLIGHWPLTNTFGTRKKIDQYNGQAAWVKDNKNVRRAAVQELLLDSLLLSDTWNLHLCCNNSVILMTQAFQDMAVDTSTRYFWPRPFPSKLL